MKLQDYLHYYMGATYWTDNSQGEVNPETLRHIYPMIEKGKGVQLHLRRLEDMTEGEIRTYGSLVQLRTDGVHSVYISCDSPESFHYLLQQHFDLFGLIDAGLAVDIKTVKP